MISSDELDLEAAADELLRDSVQSLGRGDYPWYSDRWLRQLSERPDFWPADYPVDPTYLPAVCLRLLAQTPMRPACRAALRLSIHGHTVRAIASELAVSPSTAWRQIRQATALLAAAATTLDNLYTPREAIHLTYTQQSRRRRPERKRHCRPGHEACKRTHTCPFRWYLN